MRLYDITRNRIPIPWIPHRIRISWILHQVIVLTWRLTTFSYDGVLINSKLEEWYVFFGNGYVHAIMEKKKIQINYIEHHIWSDCVEYQILFSSTGRIIFHDLSRNSLEKKTLHACLATVKNVCNGLVLSKSLMMCSYFLFRLLALAFSIPVLACTTADGRWPEWQRIVRCQGLQGKSAKVYKKPPSKQRSWWEAVQTHQIDKISYATPHSPSVALPTRQSNTRTQTLLGSITTTMKVRGDAKPLEHSQTMRPKRTVPATATIRTRSTRCVSRASRCLTSAGLLRHRNAHVNVHG